MFNREEVAKLAVMLYGVETLSLVTSGETQQVTPEAFVPGALRVLEEVAKVERMGVEAYLAANAPQTNVPGLPPGRYEPVPPDDNG